MQEPVLRPLLSSLPVPARTDYPIKDLAGKTIGEQRSWSIGAVCGCFGMYNSGLNCCCANCCIPWYTYGNALKYMAVGSVGATVSAALPTINYGDSDAGRAAQQLANLNAAIQGQKRREMLIRALGLYREGSEGFFLRCCCAPCVQCQEIDTVMLFYRDSLGYTDIKYGDCSGCKCTRFYSQGRVIPFPDQIYKGESIGPYYPKTDLPNGYHFEQGIPKQGPRPSDAPNPNAMSRGVK